MIRSYMGDEVRVKMQAGGHEEEHNATIYGMKWLQTGSGHGKGPNSGWRNAQAGGISEQFTLDAPVVPSALNVPGASTDFFYSMDAGNDGWWSGMWGVFRAYNANRADLFRLPTTRVPILVSNPLDFRLGTICPRTAPLRTYDISAVLANTALTNAFGVTIPANDNPIDNVGGPLNGLAEPWCTTTGQQSWAARRYRRKYPARRPWCCPRTSVRSTTRQQSCMSVRQIWMRVAG